MPAGGKGSAAEVHVDVVPPGELAAHGREDLPIGVLDAAEGLIGEHDPETEGVVGGVTFGDRDLVPRVQLLGERREVQAAGTTAKDRDTHGAHPFFPGPDAMSELLRSSIKRDMVPS